MDEKAWRRRSRHRRRHRDLAILARCSLWHTAVIAVGGDHYQRHAVGLPRRFRTPKRQARGGLRVVDGRRRRDIEVASVGGRRPRVMVHGESVVLFSPRREMFHLTGTRSASGHEIPQLRWFTGGGARSRHVRERRAIFALPSARCRPGWVSLPITQPSGVRDRVGLVLYVEHRGPTKSAPRRRADAVSWAAQAVFRSFPKVRQMADHEGGGGGGGLGWVGWGWGWGWGWNRCGHAR